MVNVMKGGDMVRRGWWTFPKKV